METYITNTRKETTKRPTEKIERQTEKIEKFFNSLIDKSSKYDIKQWRGHSIITKMFHLYLFHKYKLNCLGFANQFSTFKYSQNFKLLQFYLYNYKFSNDANKSNNLLADVIVECIRRKEEIIPIPLVLYRQKLDNTEISHQNVLIYRHITNSFEHFEPLGSYHKYENEGRLLQEKLRNFIETVNGKLQAYKLPEVALINSDICCPYAQGLQSIECVIPQETIKSGEKEARGYCVAWSLLFTEVILRNPKLDSMTINNIIFNHILPKTSNYSLYLKQIIRGFVISLNEKIEKYFSEMLKEELFLEKIYENTKNYERAIDFFIKIEANKMTNRKYNPKKVMNEYKRILMQTEGTEEMDIADIETLKENISLFGKIDTLKKVTPPTPITPSPSPKSSLSPQKIQSLKYQDGILSTSKTIDKTLKSNFFDKQTNEEEGPAPTPYQIKRTQKLSPKTSLSPRTPRSSRKSKSSKPSKSPLTKKKLPRCPKGTRRNKKTGKCEPI
jgi:hypothetical protein